MRVRNVISSASLPRDARDSVWYRIYQERDNATFISTTSLDADAFDFLLLNFSKYYVVKSGRGKGGRPPRLVHKHAVLACLLHFYSSAVELKTLSEVFAVVPSTLSVILRKAELALEKALGTIDDARICFPSKETQMRWASATNEKEPSVEGVFGFADGKNLRVQEPTEIDLQNAMYNGII